MRLRDPLLLVFLSVAVLLAGKGIAWGEEERLLFELRVGPKRCDVTPGTPFEIRLTGRVRLEAVLQHGPRTYVGHGIRFSYPGDLEVRTDEVDRGIAFSVSRGASKRMQITLSAPRGGTPEQALSDAIPRIRDAMAEDHATDVKVEPIRVEIAGEVRMGFRLACVGGDDPLRRDWYASEFEGRWLTVVVRWRRSERAQADALLRGFADSLTLFGEADTVPEPGPAFELQVGKRSYPVEVDEPFRLVDSRGKEHEAVLVRGLKEYAQHGVAFSYPGDLVEKTEDLFGRVKITVERGQDYFASFQVFENTAVPTVEARDLSAKFIRSSVERRTGRRIGGDEPCQRTFLGDPCLGTRFSTLGDEDPVHVEVHGIKIGERTVAVLFYWVGSANDAAEKAFDQIASTLREAD